MAENGICFQSKFIFKNDKVSHENKNLSISRIEEDSLIKFFFDYNVEAITTNPTKQDIHMSHDAEHFVGITYNEKHYCYVISGLLVVSNPDNLRTQWIVLLADEDVSSVKIDGVRIRGESYIKKKKGKNGIEN